MITAIAILLLILLLYVLYLLGSYVFNLIDDLLYRFEKTRIYPAMPYIFSAAAISGLLVMWWMSIP